MRLYYFGSSLLWHQSHLLSFGFDNRYLSVQHLCNVASSTVLNRMQGDFYRSYHPNVRKLLTSGRSSIWKPSHAWFACPLHRQSVLMLMICIYIYIHSIYVSLWSLLHGTRLPPWSQTSHVRYRGECLAMLSGSSYVLTWSILKCLKGLHLSRSLLESWSRAGGFNTWTPCSFCIQNGAQTWFKSPCLYNVSSNSHLWYHVRPDLCGVCNSIISSSKSCDGRTSFVWMLKPEERRALHNLKLRHFTHNNNPTMHFAASCHY